MNHWLPREQGFGLIELTIVIVVIGILVAVAMQSMTALVEDTRRVKTEREMEILANAIVGNPSAMNGGRRSDFGYIGDVGAFPPNLQALYQNPGGYSTWDGPYIPSGFTQDSTGFKTDEWGSLYNYSGGITITSTGSGTTFTKKIADATSDYLLNTLNGTVKDANDSLPGSVYDDSIDIKVTIPNGFGSNVTKTYRPDSTGVFTLDSLPVGQHELRIIYTPEVDTLFRYLTILPRNKSSRDYRFAEAYFSSGSGSGCAGSGIDTLKPVGAGTTTGLIPGGCTINWQCVADSTGYVRAVGSSFMRDEYETEDPSDTSCTITSVTVFFEARRMGTPASGGAILRTHGILYQPAIEALANSFTIYNHQWTTNPYTGSAWTWTEVINVEIGVRLKRNPSGGNNPRCARVWAEIQYSE
jgi:prepilin-type N-terminal cleavage/methylation domain-containing protein